MYLNLILVVLGIVLIKSITNIVSVEKSFLVNNIKPFIISTIAATFFSGFVILLLIYALSTTFINSAANSSIYMLFMYVIVVSILLYFNDYILMPRVFLFYNKARISEEFTKKLKKEGLSGKVIIISDSKNALTMGGSKGTSVVFLGSRILEDLSSDEVLGILYHEIAHIKFNHIYVLMMIRIVTICVYVLVFRYVYDMTSGNPYFYIPIIGLLGGVLPFFRMCFRRFEQKADMYAAQNVGIKTYISALTKLNKLNLGGMDKFDIEHYKFNERIKKIKCIGEV